MVIFARVMRSIHLCALNRRFRRNFRNTLTIREATKAEQGTYANRFKNSIHPHHDRRISSSFLPIAFSYSPVQAESASQSMADASLTPIAQVAAFLRLPISELEKLSKAECWWRDHQSWLAEQGYMLRPRYRSGWTPSWHTRLDLIEFNHEDSHRPGV